MLKGLLRGLAFIHHPANREAVVEIFERRMRVARPAAEEAYLEAVESLDRKPYPAPEGLLNIRRMFARTTPRAASIRIDQVIDTRTLRKLDDSGFLDAVYNSPAAR